MPPNGKLPPAEFATLRQCVDQYFQGYNWPEGEDSPKTRRSSVYVKVTRALIYP